MRTLLRATACLTLAGLLATPLAAQERPTPQPCAPYAKMAGNLEAKYGELPVWWHVHDADTLFVGFGGPSGSWTMAVVVPRGSKMTCLVGAGTGFVMPVTVVGRPA